MTKIIFIVSCILFIVLAVSFSIKKNASNKDRRLRVESVAFNTVSGWGYNILVDHKIFIHQENIPAIAGKKPFTNREDAMKTAALVVEKIMQQKSPGVSVTDLKALKISY